MKYPTVTIAALTLSAVLTGCKQSSPQAASTPQIQPPPLQLKPVKPATKNPKKLGDLSPKKSAAKKGKRGQSVSRLSDSLRNGNRLPAGATTYQVQTGETYWSIATKRLGDGHRWKEIESLNPSVNKDDLKIGQTIRIPKK